MEKKRGLHQYLNYFKRKREARMTLVYSVSYFVFITLLFVFGSVARGQTSDTYKHIQQQEQAIPQDVEASLMLIQ